MSASAAVEVSRQLKVTLAKQGLAVREVVAWGPECHRDKRGGRVSVWTLFVYVSPASVQRVLDALSTVPGLAVSGVAGDQKCVYVHQRQKITGGVR
ncbi:hypothetical protein GCM10012275_64540 [Longimycelium tulufanense]|uniref:Uncharacterized protein n=1 Tax=Longimycelium tulufanense TaxID=907463 RepID=A0A8J3CEX2_9PSEU|nr:hypothetical protein [Longimycelium tulufanense]GGM84884.1 hypothetical protein GCM10012275_64540 [Longimycelium tulufanense]